MSLKIKIIRAFSWGMLDKLTSHLGSLAITVYVARLIGPESFGIVGMLTIFLLLADGIVTGGFSSALVQRSQELTEDESSTAFWCNVIYGGGIYIVLYCAAPWIAEFYHQPELVDIARALFLTVLINAFAVVVRAKLMIAVDFKNQAIANGIAMLFSGMIALYSAKTGYGLWAIVWLMISKSFFTTLGLWYLCPWVPAGRFNRSSFNTLFGFGSRLMLAGFIATIVNNLYVALVGRYYSALQVGYFVQASNLSTYLYQFISSSLHGVTYPVMTFYKNDSEKLIEIYKRLLSITMFVSFPALVGFAAIANDVILLFLSEEWLPMAPVLILLCIARTLTPISAINMNILNAIGRPDLYLKVDLMKLPLSLVGLYVALPYGIQGLAWISVFTSFVAYFMNAWYPGKFFGLGGVAQLRLAAPYIIASVFMYALLSLIKLDLGMLGIIYKVAVGVGAYIGLLYFFDDIWVRKAIQIVLNIYKRYKSGI